MEATTHTSSICLISVQRKVACYPPHWPRTCCAWVQAACKALRPYMRPGCSWNGTAPLSTANMPFYVHNAAWQAAHTGDASMTDSIEPTPPLHPCSTMQHAIPGPAREAKTCCQDKHARGHTSVLPNLSPASARWMPLESPAGTCLSCVTDSLEALPATAMLPCYQITLQTCFAVRRAHGATTMTSHCMHLAGAPTCRPQQPLRAPTAQQADATGTTRTLCCQPLAWGSTGTFMPVCAGTN
jgi:hypothetical protein